MDKQRWGLNFARWGVTLTIVGCVVAGVGLMLARYDIIPKLVGFAALMLGGLGSILALLAGLIALVLGRGQDTGRRGSLLAAMAVATAFAGFVISRPLAAGNAPAIHDVTTALSDPPQFEVLKLRSDNLAGVGTLANWRRIHSAAYSDIGPLRLDRPVQAVMADVHKLAEANGWTVAAFDPDRGRLEATASVSFIRFHDDVVVTVMPAPHAPGSVVNMRSVSRIGVGDLGINAARIRAFLTELGANHKTA